MQIKKIYTKLESNKNKNAYDALIIIIKTNFDKRDYQENEAFNLPQLLFPNESKFFLLPKHALMSKNC